MYSESSKVATLQKICRKFGINMTHIMSTDIEDYCDMYDVDEVLELELLIYMCEYHDSQCAKTNNKDSILAYDIICKQYNKSIKNITIEMIDNENSYLND